MLTLSTRPLFEDLCRWGPFSFIHPKPKLCSLRLVPWCVYIVSSNLLGYPSSLIEKYTPLVETWSQLVNRFDFCKLPSAVRQSKRVLRLLCGDDSLRGSFGKVVKRGHKLMVEKIGRGASLVLFPHSHSVYNLQAGATKCVLTFSRLSLPLLVWTWSKLCFYYCLDIITELDTPITQCVW